MAAKKPAKKALPPFMQGDPKKVAAKKAAPKKKKPPKKY